jgi:hypothetical protein
MVSRHAQIYNNANTNLFNHLLIYIVLENKFKMKRKY